MSRPQVLRRRRLAYFRTEALRLSKYGAEAMITLSPVFAPLVDLAQNISHVTQTSNSKAWLSFGVYVYEAIRQVLFGLDIQQFPCGSGLVDNVKGLEMMLRTILCEASSIVNRTLLPRFLHRILYDEHLIHDLRKELDDCLALFQMRAIALMSGDLSEVLAKVRRLHAHSESSGAAGPASAPQNSDQQRRPKRNFSQTTRDERNRTCIDGTLSSETEPNRVAFASTVKSPGLEDSIHLASEVVQSYRQLSQRHPRHLRDLARSLNDLANLLAEAGELQLAFTVGQEATEIYRALTEKQPGLYCSTFVA